MQTMDKSRFKRLNEVDVSDVAKDKNGLSYIDWATAWEKLCEIYPNSTFFVHEQILDEYGNTRPWFDDGKSGWVKVTVNVGDESDSITETLPIMDFKNKSIPADMINSDAANKSMKRCLVKAIAMLGLGLFVYRGEDAPADIIKAKKLGEECYAIMAKKAKASEAVKKKAAEVRDNILPDECGGDPRNCMDVEILETLRKELMKIRVVKSTKEREE